jgi:gag-polypeptide of LTR copia-type
MAEDRNLSKSSQIISVKLNGAENYLLWSRQILMYLRGQRLTGYITGIVKRPEATIEKMVELQKWEADDGQVMSWLINSMEVRLQNQFMMLDTALQVWDRAAEMYSQKGNHGQVYHLQTKADCLVQGEMSVTEFFSELNNMWEQMDFFDPLAMTCTVDALAFKN